MNGPIGLIGAPTSAGAFAPGQEKAPQALRDVGFTEEIEDRGIELRDFGDIDPIRWSPDRENPFAQNIEEIVRAVSDISDAVETSISKGYSPLIVGGDCTVLLGVIDGYIRSEVDVGLIYFDLHPDLNVPERCNPGALDWMGMAHILAIEGSIDDLSRFGVRSPLLSPDKIFFLGFGDENRTSWEREVMEEYGLNGLTCEEVRDNPREASKLALQTFDSIIDTLIVHFDVDTVNFTDFPISEGGYRNEGFSLDESMDALHGLLEGPTVDSLVITEINPDHSNDEILYDFSVRMANKIAQS